MHNNLIEQLLESQFLICSLVHFSTSRHVILKVVKNISSKCQEFNAYLYLPARLNLD